MRLVCCFKFSKFFYTYFKVIYFLFNNKIISGLFFKQILLKNFILFVILIKTLLVCLVFTNFVYKSVFYKETLASERDILISSIRKSNLPRFLSEDTPLFINIMKDLFPKMVSNEQKSKELQVFVTDNC